MGFDCILAYDKQVDMNHILFKPLYQERVWGGRAFDCHFGRKLPEDRRIGESWEIVDRTEANSVAVSRPFAGQTLREILEQHAGSIMGPGWEPTRPFPILVKWLDCQERLSLQVHPPASKAKALGGEPKTENWFIAAASEDAAVLAGLKPGVTRESFEKALREEQLEALVCRLPCRSGDSLFVPSGRLHAIDAGNLILEIQQNSDTTYRVYDWGREGLDGKPRQLHIEASLESIDFGDVAPELIHSEGSRQTLVEAEEFTLRRLTLAKGESLEFVAHRQPRILSLISGALKDSVRKDVLQAGDNALLPYAGAFAYTAEENTTLLVTEAFA